MSDTQTILICTVGGSHQPIVSAIEELRPDHVVFVCTGKDPATGRPGSDIQITGKGNCIKANYGDDKPTLPAIPVQVGLTADQYTLVKTVSDDLDQVYLDCTQTIENTLRNFPDARIVADYTGGTKSMTTGLVLAVLQYPEIELQLVTGSRADLVRVRDGSQASALANIEQIRFQRMLAPYRQCWQRYAYSEAEAGLQQIAAPRDNQLRATLNKFRDLSRAFSEWDNFNHGAALDILQTYAPALPGGMKPYIGMVMRLNDQDSRKRDAARLCDLYLNALRRARQGRYDDAVARIYRLIEWTAQWLLLHQCGIDTSDVKEEEIPAGIQLTQNREGRWQAGLFIAWQLVGVKTTGAASKFIEREEARLQNHIKIRNQSILAHGFSPVGEQNWQAIEAFISDEFMPMLLQETACVGIKTLPQQLPDAYGA